MYLEELSFSLIVKIVILLCYFLSFADELNHISSSKFGCIDVDVERKVETIEGYSFQLPDNASFVT